MKWLTRQEQFVLCTVLALLLVGVAVKTYRTSHTDSKPAAGSEATNTPVVVQ